MNLPAPEVTVTVLSRTDVGEVAVLELGPTGPALPAWEPGAHVDVLLPDAVVRQYSLCSPAGSATWRIAVLREDAGRGGSVALHRVARPGATLALAGPRNHFRFAPPAGAPVLLIAGGIGVTPLLPMAEAAAVAGADYALHVAGHPDRLPFAEELAARHGDRLVLHLAGRDPRLDVAALLREAAPGTVVYCCGPARLLAAVEAEAAAAGLDLHVEHFTPAELSEPAPATSFEVEFSGSGVTATVPPDRSILAVAEEHGIFVLSSCQAGTCGTCETTVLEGEVDHRDSILTPAERERGDLMYVCVSRARSARLVVDL